MAKQYAFPPRGGNDSTHGQGQYEAVPADTVTLRLPPDCPFTAAELQEYLQARIDKAAKGDQIVFAVR